LVENFKNLAIMLLFDNMLFTFFFWFWVISEPAFLARPVLALVLLRWIQIVFGSLMILFQDSEK
jgi:hypothetical protein